MTTPRKCFPLGERMRTLPPYIFARLDQIKQEVMKRRSDIIDISIGDPDLPTPAPILDAMTRAIRNPSHHRYPAYAGSDEFRTSCADYLKRRIGVKLDPNKEILTLIGSKEGIAHLPLAFVDPGDTVLVPDPGYPVYSIASVFCGGQVHSMPLLRENNFLPDLDAIPDAVWRKARILFLNYPNNPTGARADESFFKHAIQKASHFGTLIAHDAAYFEMYTGRERPLSILEIEGGRDWSIEFYSHSKTYNMTGWRLGFAAGNARAVEALGRIKSNLDSGVFTAIQEAGIVANSLPASQRDEIRRIYARRRQAAVPILKKAGYDVFDAGATFYVWAKVPGRLTSTEFAMNAIEKAGVLLTPGNGFGRFGEGYFRLALCASDEKIKEACHRLGKMIST